MMKRVELLAPAGSYEALIAAVQNGADAVYLGGTEFSARAYASNFDIETLKQAIEYAHVREVKVYVTINTIIKDKEKEALLSHINKLYSIGVDAIIVQDLGVVQIVREIYPDLELHSSTQMTLHNSEGINLLSDLGVKRVVLARELSLKEIKTIRSNTRVELEIFIHGALCYSYSGQCLMSSFIGGRSGNRGRCAQPCRKKYELFPLNKNNKSRPNQYYLSMRDLNALEMIGKIIESGVLSLKIEGRMKKPQYVASVVRAYRKAINDFLIHKKTFKDPQTTKHITQIFNRKFTQGFLLRSTAKSILNPEKPNNRGLFLGKVQAYNINNQRLRIMLMEDIQQGDGIEIWGKSRNIGGIINKIYISNKLTHKASKEKMVDIQLPGKIEKGDDVYKTLDLQLMKDIEKTYQENIENRKTKIYAKIHVEKDMPLKLWIWDKEENKVYIQSQEIVEEARTVALTEKKVIDSLIKLKDTPFEIENIEVIIDGNVSIPISSINKARREAVEALINLKKNKHKKQPKCLKRITPNKHPYLRNISTEKHMPRIAAKVDTFQQLKLVLQHQIERIYYGSIHNIGAALALCKKNKVEMFFRSPSIIKDYENEKLKEILRKYSFDGILAGELSMLVFGRDVLNVPVIADTSLNIMNSSTIELLEKQGISGIALSPELDLKSIKELKVNRALEVEVLVYGKLPVMIAEACPLSSGDLCNHQCERCKDKPFNYLWGLKDEKDAIFPLTKDDWGRTVIVNSYPLYMQDKVRDLSQVQISSYRMEFTNETPHEIENRIKELRESVRVHFTKEIVEGNSKHKVPINQFTRGHFYRGIE